MTDPKSSPPKFKAPPPMFDPVKESGAAEPNEARQAVQPRPPPPKFSAPPQRLPDAAKAAAAAAARAAKHATPAQREKLAAEAAAQAIAQHAEAAEAAASQPQQEQPQQQLAAPKPPPGPYQPPEWGGIPANVPYALEVLKQGTILATVDLRQLCLDANKSFLALGRSPDNDILLDHPSSSRLHAVLQFRGSDGGAFLLDPGSTHGCYVNKARAAAGQYTALRVGDMLRFGESSRTHVLCGPAEMMQEEAPSKEQRRQAAALEAMKAQQAIDAAAAKAAMAKVIAGGGVSWGFGMEAADFDEAAGAEGEDIDWRAYLASKGGGTEKQQKLAEKIRKREARVAALQREAENIQAKQRSMEELTMGQADTLARNEAEIDRAMAEAEELEDSLLESIRDSISGGKKKAGKERGDGVGRKKRSRAQAGSDEEGVGGSSDDDAFYDRTGEGARKKGGKRGSGAGKKGRGAEQEVEDAASLYGKLETLREELVATERQLLAEEAEQAKHGGGGGWVGGGGDDSLEEFMRGVDAKLETDKVAVLKKEAAEIKGKVERTERLLKLADPDGYFKPGSKVAAAAVQRARAEQQQQQRKRQAAAAAAAAAKLEEEKPLPAAATAPMEEKPLLPPPSKPSPAAHQQVHRLEALNGSSGGGDGAGENGGLEVRVKPKPAPPTVAAAARGSSPPATSAYESRRAHIAASLQSMKNGGSGNAAAAGTAPPGTAAVAAEADDAAKRVLSDLAVLQQAKRGAGAAGAADAEAEEWVPPEGQKGDGRTSLNDRLGY